MNPLRMIWDYITRLRHAYGFGVHSPHAFRMITEVINQPYAYYCYKELASMADYDGHTARNLALVFRVALDQQPDRVYIADGQRKTTITAFVRKAVPSAEIVSNPAEAELIIVGGDTLPPVEACTRPGVTTVVLSTATPTCADFVARVGAAAKEGQSFDDKPGRPWIFVCRPGTPRQHFPVAYRRVRLS